MDQGAQQVADLISTINDTWVERLLSTLLSYSIVLLPIAFIVIITKFNLIPKKVRDNTLIRWFVYGDDAAIVATKSYGEDGERLLGSNSSLQTTCKLVSKYNSSSNTLLDFLWCLFGLQSSYLCWGILQEKIMTTQYFVTAPIVINNQGLNLSNQTLSQPITFHDSQFLVFLNRLTAFIMSIFALIYNRPRRPKLFHDNLELTKQSSKPPAPLYKYIYCSISNILSSWCQIEALKYVNFPTQVLSKSCKIIPVMLMSKLMMRKKYRLSEYTSAILLSIGMTLFLIYQPPKQHPIDSASSQNSTLSLGQATNDSQSVISEYRRANARSSGLAILALYLAFDSFTSNWQNNLFDTYSITNWQMMAATNFYSIVLTLTSLYQLGNLKPTTQLLLSSRKLLRDCLFMSFMSAVGQLFVYHTIKKFGSVIFVSIMTLRLFLAVTLSCLIYGHQLGIGSINGLVIVFLVVGYQAASKLNSLRKREGIKQEVISFKTLSK